MRFVFLTAAQRADGMSFVIQAACMTEEEYDPSYCGIKSSMTIEFDTCQSFLISDMKRLVLTI
ncbi:hypothetical protein BY458DRAFT_508597 [Sporodiniella umbellata]|nr:hypothetical protein BY458DRAFT_508597 [Sporodiniella umbellata]